MKLRRALAAAATTAVIAPIALLSAPAAFATGETPTPTASESTPAAEESTPAAEESTPTAEESTPAAEESTPAAEESTPAASTSPSASASESTEPSESAEPSEEPDYPYCEEVDENFEEQALDSEISGLPGKIVAGSGWHTFSLTVTNTSKATLNQVAVYAEVENFEIEDPDKFLSPYVELEFLNPATKQWEEIRETYEDEHGEPQEWAGGYFWGLDKMAPQDYIKSKLRLNVHKDAPVGDGYSFGTGAYLDTINGQDCIAESYGTDAYFTVLKPGSSNEDPGEAKPGDGTHKPGPETKPQGGVEELPVTGNLAETGSSSNLPVLGTIGGIAIVAGAGVVFAMKRRKVGAEA
ncbi:LAETG motif-containing sortase-dependent surface protein [Streptomyces sp. NPDC057740]|uniref:LAETG motif-containing sortase-dependent surface protein n=1 Tax=Streptomyces sp. NPDC057740 TaxID=3346234 RepID=UPI0036B9D6CD